MVRGIYSSAAGMETQYKRIDVLGNNISNIDTPGFKENDMTFTDFGQELATRTTDGTEVGTMPYCVVLGGETTDLTDGALKNTGISTDFAVDGNGFFAVQTPTGVAYTRGGDFTVDAQGFLALSNGERLLGQNGQPLNVGGNNFSVAENGAVTLQNGQAGGTIAVYTSQNAQNITKRADGLFNITGAVAANGAVKQGWLEDSNTDAAVNMTDMMEATRTFQGCQQAFDVDDSTLNQLVTQVGSLK